MGYKCCVVPLCTNTSTKSPGKMFVSIPKKTEIRTKWLILAGRNPQSIKPNTNVFMCEDHFNMEQDMANYMQYKMGFQQNILMVKGAMPFKFDCQKNCRKKLLNTAFTRKAYVKHGKIAEEIQAAAYRAGTSTLKYGNVMPETVVQIKDEVPSAVTTTNDENQQKIEVNVNMKKNYNEDPIATDGLEDANNKAGGQTAEIKVEEAEYTSENHTGYSCDYCKGEIIGYRCIECENYDLCVACESSLVHPHHFVLRIPRPKPFNEVNRMVEEIRERIKMLTEEIQDTNNSMSLDDIKKEMPFEEVQLDPFEGLATDTVSDVPESGTDKRTQVPRARGEREDERGDKRTVTAFAASMLKEWDMKSDTTEIPTSEYLGSADNTAEKRKRKHSFSDESRDTNALDIDEMRRQYADSMWRDEINLRAEPDDIRRIENVEVEWLDESILESDVAQNQNDGVKKISIENEDIEKIDEEVVKNTSDIKKTSFKKQVLQKGQKVKKAKIEEMGLNKLLQTNRKKVNILSKSSKFNR